MPEKEAGRRWVVGVIVANVAGSVLAALVLRTGSVSGRLLDSLISLLITLALSVFLYRGANWARLVVGVLSLFGVPVLLIGLWNLLVGHGGGYFISTGLISSFVAGVLLFVPSVRAYFDEVRAGTTG